MVYTIQQEIFDAALAQGLIGLALLDERLDVVRRLGALSDWLPPEGEPACNSPLLVNMEETLETLREDFGREIVLPSMRTAPDKPRVTVSMRWNALTRNFMIVTAPDHAGEQIDRLLASDRREKQILRQQADAAATRLRLADTLYREIVESSDNLVLRFDPNCKIVFANRAAAAFVGRPQDALIGARLDAFFPTPDNALCRLEQAEEGLASFETPLRDAKGRTVWLAWDVSFLGADANGEFQALARDVTAERRLRVERERVQEEARAAAITQERLRIAHDLHDTLVRSIVTMIAEARLIAKKTSDPQAKTALANLDAQARLGLWEAREAIAQTRAARREDLRAIVADFETRWRGVAVEIDFQNVETLPPEAELLFAAVLREALRNVELHAGATRVHVAIVNIEDRAELVVEDDGAGFDPYKPPPGHFGVTGMHERAAFAGAVLKIDSEPGKGTRVTLSMKNFAGG
jgi:PAS domain S-box-containing protein